MATTARTKAMKDRDKRTAAAIEFVKPDALVWYEARPGTKYPATVDGHPWNMGGQMVVRLRNLPAAYAATTSRQATYVPAAATWCLSPREASK